MLKETLLILASRFFFLVLNPLVALFKVAIRLFILNHALIFLHRIEVQLQAKNN
jgi:hypothetical protein